MKKVLLFVGLLMAVGCQSNTKKKDVALIEGNSITKEVLSDEALQQYETAYFASGCFWCVEAIFESVKGIKEVVSGYSGGKEENPSYEDVAYGRTGHAEAVEVYYDPNKISFLALVQVFFGSHDPTSLNRQGPDRGTQYRSIAFYKNEKEKKVIEDYIKLLESEKVYDRPIVTEVTAFDTFWKAEDYHQDYYNNNRAQGYCRVIIDPKVRKLRDLYSHLLK